MKKRIFTKEEIETVIYNYTVLGMGQKRAGKQFHMKDRQVKRLLQENNIHIKSIQETNISHYKIDEEFFEKQSSDMAYVLGMLGSDGCISSNENCIYIELQEQDSELLEKINNKLKNERPIKHYVTSRGYHNCKLYFYSKRIKDILKEYRLVPNKTYSDEFGFPEKLDKIFWLDYIRGYFDGDGCIKKTGSSLTFQLDSVKKSLLKTIQNFLKEEHNIECQLTSNKKDKMIVWRLYCYSDSAEKIFNLLYKDPSCLKMKRKFDKFLLYKK